MKIKLLTILLLFVTFMTFSQENDTDNIRIHELRLDGLKLLAGPIVETSYEFVKNENSGYGVSILVNLGSDSSVWVENFSITPFYRFYFFNKEDYGAKGFFVEGFGKLSTGDNSYQDIFYNDLEEENFTDLSLGMSLGQKWVNKNGFVFELLLGVSRTLGANSAGSEAYLRGGLSVGYRF